MFWIPQRQYLCHIMCQQHCIHCNSKLTTVSSIDLFNQRPMHYFILLNSHILVQLNIEKLNNYIWEVKAVSERWAQIQINLSSQQCSCRRGWILPIMQCMKGRLHPSKTTGLRHLHVILKTFLLWCNPPCYPDSNKMLPAMHHEACYDAVHELY